MKEEENLIHLKFDYAEALSSKQDLLYSQKSLLIMDGTISEISSLKQHKINVGMKLHKTMKETATCLRSIQRFFPGLKIPKILKENSIEEDSPEVEERIKPVREKDDGDDLEAQIKEIQEKLKSIK